MTTADQWLDAAPAHWTRGRLKNLIAAATNGTWGADPSGDGSDVRCVRAADFDRECRRVDLSNAPLRHVDPASLRQHLLRPGDLILEKSGGGEKQPVGMAVLFTDRDRAVCSNFCARIKPSDDVDPRFLTYVFAAAYGQGLTQAAIKQTTGIQNLDTGAFFASRWAYPAPEEQRRIADFLDAETAGMDRLVESQVRLTELLEEREEAAISLALSRAAASTIRLKHLLVAPPSYGANEAAEHDRRDWPRYIRTTDITEDGTLRDETFASLPPEVAQRYLLEDGDILLVRSGSTTGKAFLYESRLGPAAHAGYLIRARVDHRAILPRLVWYFCQTPAYWQQISEGAVKSTIQNVNAEKYGNIVVPFIEPGRQVSTLQQIDSLTHTSKRLKERALRLLDLLAERRQALITAAVTGTFDVSTASGRNVAEGVGV
ncbi:hypothetical protein ACFYZJ_13435 [Streptomyces sp. NPDC001848]|uniref:hypothetical protein n=1 Tax=Streptomyces sp. NPDC001848 TaxID=3364618 RepID=UPI0036AA77AF